MSDLQNGPHRPYMEDMRQARMQKGGSEQKKEEEI